MQELPRGLRINNPCNIRQSNANWLGEVLPSSDLAFVQFDTPENGIRAGARILLNYQRIDGLSTLRQFISRWAPPSDNDTSTYLTNVCNALGADPDVPYDVTDGDRLAALVCAVIKQEQGQQPFSPDVVQAAVTAALA